MWRIPGDTRRTIVKRAAIVLLLFGVACNVIVPSGARPTPSEPAPVPTHTAPPNPEGTAAAFLDAWVAADYAGMYSLLSPLSQAAITLEDFVARYEEAADEMTLTRVDVTVLSSLQQDLDAQVQYRVTLNTALVGAITREITMELRFDGGRWGVSWDDGLILPELAGGNRLLMEFKVPARGNIYDRNGLALAAQTEAVAIGVVPGQIDPAREEELLHQLSLLVGRHPENIRLLYESAQPDWYVPIGEAAVAAVEERYDTLAGMPGLVLNPYPTRFYVGAGLGAPHVVGYTRLIPDDDLDRYRALGYRGDERVGALGLEAWGESYLTGERGGTLYVVDPAGKIVAELARRGSAASKSITTTIDRDFQHQVQNALGELPGAIVVLDMHTGEVLAMASAPTFDANVFDPANTNALELDVLLNNPDAPLVNRATQGAYPPGSTFKVVTASAALESGLFTPETSYYCGQSWNELGPNFIKFDWTYDHNVPASGDLDIVGAIRRSCNPWFYHIGLNVFEWDEGYLEALARGFGLGEPTGITGLQADANEEVGGTVPGPQWAAETGNAWLAGDNVNMAIGQAALQVTPLQMARLYAAIGNGGDLYRPQLIESIAGPGEAPVYEFAPEVTGKLPVSPETLAVIQQGLWEVVNARTGTARGSFLGLDVPIYGKTGTAQDPPRAPHAWFVGYTQAARDDRPDIAIAVVLENRGEGSQWAAPIFRRVVEIYFSGRATTLYPWEAELGLIATPQPDVTPAPDDG
ncbi:MAG: penicillin-binding transpeptidase domain-containing protein [Anaerolineales bacterium]